MNFVWFILIGVAVGCLLGYLTNASGCGVLGDIAVGVVGAFLGVFTFGPLIIGLGSSVGRLIGSAIATTMGTVILSVLLRLFKRPTSADGMMGMPMIRVGLRSVLLGGLLAVVGAFSVAALVALVFRFAIPFTGYCSGPGAVLPSLVAVLVYGCIGGFPLLAVLGVVGRFVAYLIGKQDGRKAFRLTLAFAVLVDFLAMLTLAVLDKIIGHW